MMDANRAGVELESSKLRTQLAVYQSDLDNIRRKVEKLTEENEILRNRLKDSQSGMHSDGLLNLNNDSIIEIQRRQLELLEQEKEDAMNLYERSRETILRLEEKIEDLEDPLKPHLIQLDMQNKQAAEEHARAEVQLIQEINMISDELKKRSKELVDTQLQVKEIERENQALKSELYQKQDELRSHLKKEIGYDGTIIAFQNAIDELEVRLQQALKEKEASIQQRDDMELKLKNVTEHDHSLQAKLAEALHQLQQQIDAHSALDHGASNASHDQMGHDFMHRTIDELIQQAAVKTRNAVEDLRQQYNENLQRLMEKCDNLEETLSQRDLEFDKCLRSKRTIEDELEKILQERRLNLEKSALDNEGMARRCIQAERERDEVQLKYEQNQQAYKLLRQSYDAEKTNHELKQKELTDRTQKITHDLDKMTHDYTTTFNELNELKKKLSSTHNEQILMQRRTTELVKRHEEQMVEKEKECLVRLQQRDDVNRVTFNELRNLVNRQQRMIVKYKEECHTIASQSETKISELKQKIDNLRSRNEKLQSEVADVKRKEVEMDRILAKNSNRMKVLEDRLHDAEEQAVESSRRVAKQLVRDRLALAPYDHYSYSNIRLNNPAVSNNFKALRSNDVPLTTIADSTEHGSEEK